MQPIKTPRQMLLEEAGIVPKLKAGGKSKPPAKSPRPKKVKK